jgi:hypothetical protein
MQFRIADTFSDSLAKLTDSEQKATKTAVFDLQVDPANPGMQLHRLDRAKDRCFWSVRVNRDLRIIVHRTSSSFMLCYVAHHDDAYAWAERRKIETHPKTGAAQLVEIREVVREIVVPVHMPAAPEPPPAPLEERLFAERSDDELLGWGVPEEWLSEVREATEGSVLELAEHLPAEAGEALLVAAIGEEPAKPVAIAEPEADAFEHPDAQRRFRTLRDRDELERALDSPWEKWAVFLHPKQRAVVERDDSGPARVSGSAGTGKTVVALHRAVFLTRRDPDGRTLLTTFSEPLAGALVSKLWTLAGNEPRLLERLDVRSIGEVAAGLYHHRIAKHDVAEESELRTLLEEASAGCELPFSRNFLWLEWHHVIDAWDLRAWEAYRDVARTGRRTRIGAKQREALWAVFERVRERLADTGKVTRAERFHRLADALGEGASRPYDYVIADESQDLGVPELRFLGALAPDRPNALFFAGDLGQRIFQPPFSWKSLGIDIRGRSHTLRVNYRTSHQIRTSADRLLPEKVADADGVEESRRGTVSVFNGPQPRVGLFEDEDAEIEAVASWLRERLDSGVSAHQIGVFVRSDSELERARRTIEMARGDAHLLRDEKVLPENRIALGTMHHAKGLEFRAVAVMACDDEVIPNQERIESAGDLADVEEIYDTERHLLYVACTRARDELWVSGVVPGSEFLADMR